MQWLKRTTISLLPFLAALSLFAAQPAASGGKPRPELSPLFGNTLKEPDRREWRPARNQIKREWQAALGPFPRRKPPLKTEVLSTEETPEFTRQHIRYQVEAGVFTDGYLLTPRGAKRRLPAVVVFQPTTPFGARGVAGLEPDYPREKWHGVHLVRRGYLAWCPRNYINAEGADYAGNAAKVLAQHPEWTGMARMTWDAIRAMDFLVSWPGVDRKRIGCLGHSLGAKQVLYAMAFDERYRAGVFSEGGIGLRFSNWDAPWYLGSKIRDPGFGLDHHQLLALIAPRPFLLVAGDSADDGRSEVFVNAARPVYELLGAGGNLQFFNHHEGHVYSAQAREKAEEFLEGGVRAGRHPPWPRGGAGMPCGLRASVARLD